MRDDVSEIARDKMRELRANEIRNVAGGLQIGIDPGLGALISAHMLLRHLVERRWNSEYDVCHLLNRRRRPACR